MMDELKKMMDKKKMDGKMSEEEIQAKMDVIQELLEMAHGAMGSHVKNGMDEMKKVSVMAPDSESLEEGLDKAQDLVSENADDDMPTESDDHETPESDDAPGADVMAAVEAEPEDDDMNPFARKRKMMMDRKA